MKFNNMPRASQKWFFLYAVPWVLNLLLVQVAFFSFPVFLLTVGLLVGVSLFRLWKFPPNLSSSWVWLVLFLGVLIFWGSTIFSLSPARSFEWLMLNFIPALLFWLAWKDPPFPSKFLILPYIVVAILVFVSSFLSLYISLNPWITARTWPFLAFRTTVPLFKWHPNQLAHYIAVGFPFLIVLRLRGSPKEARLAKGLMSISALMLVFTNSRGGLLACLGGVTIFLFWSRQYRNWRVVFRPLWLWGIWSTLGMMFFVWQNQLRLGSALHPDFTNGRLRFWMWGLRAWLQQPFWGQGPGTWPLLHLESASIPPQFFTDMPHNLVVDLLSSTGLLGLGWGMGTLGLMLWKRGQDSSLWQKAAMASGIAWLIHHMVDETFHWGAWNLIPVTLFLFITKGNNIKTTKGDQFWQNWLLIFWRGLGLWTFVFIVFHSASLYLYERGLQYGALGYWEQAGYWMERAVRLAPWKPGYKAAAAYAYGKYALLAASSEEEREFFLRRSAALYAQSLAQEPQYAVHWANYAWVLWMLKHTNEAKHSMLQAVQRSPMGPFTFALAWMEETTGNTKRARSLYIDFLMNYPQFSLSTTFSTPTQQATVQIWKSRGQPTKWFTWQRFIYQCLLETSFDSLSETSELLLPDCNVVSPYQRRYLFRYLQTFFRAFQGDVRQAYLFSSLDPAIDLDLHFWLISHLPSISNGKEGITKLCRRLSIPSSYGAEWETADKNFRVLYRLPPPDIVDLLPGFPYPVSPIFSKMCIFHN